MHTLCVGACARQRRGTGHPGAGGGWEFHVGAGNPTQVFLFVWDRVSLCSFGVSPGTYSVGQVGLELTEIRLPLPPQCWD